MKSGAEVLAQVAQFLGYAAWYPTGVVIIRKLTGEDLSTMHIPACLSLSLAGLLFHAIAFNFIRNQAAKKAVEYKIIGEKL